MKNTRCDKYDRLALYQQEIVQSRRESRRVGKTCSERVIGAMERPEGSDVYSRLDLQPEKSRLERLSVWSVDRACQGAGRN